MYSITVPNLKQFSREDILLKKKLEEGEMGKIWSNNPLLAVTRKVDFFSVICFTAIINHAFPGIDEYGNALIE